MDCNAHILELDRFLKKSRNSLGSAKENYAMRDAHEVITDFFSDKSASYHDIGYDHDSQSTVDYGMSMKNSNSILIVEGVIAQVVMSRFNMSSMSIFVRSDENVRKQRFFKKYEKRGVSPEDINELWDVRQAEEDPFVNSQASKSQFVFDNYSKEQL